MKNLTKELLTLIEKAVIEKEGNKLFLDFSRISHKEAERLNELTGVDFEGYTRVIDEASIRHVLNRHPDISFSDLLLIPFILENYDFVSVGSSSDSLIYKKQIVDDYFYIEYRRDGQKKLAMKTFYKRKPPKPKSKRPL